MPGRPFRSRYGLSGPQPTFSQQGKARGSLWGTKRAKAGRRVGRLDAFPEEGGNRLVEVDSSDEDEVSVKRRRARSAAGSQARAIAATKRASNETARAKAVGEFEVSDVSSHSSDKEPDSDDPDRASSKNRRMQEKIKSAQKAREKKQSSRGPISNGRNDEIRGKRAAAAERRLQATQIIVVDGTDSEEEREYQEEKRKQLEEAEKTNGFRSNGGRKSNTPIQPTKKASKKKTVQSKGRRLDESDSDLEDLRQFQKQQSARRASSVADSPSPRRRTSSTIRCSQSSDIPPQQNLFNGASSDEDDDLVHPSGICTSQSRSARRQRTQKPSTNISSSRKTISTGASGSGSTPSFTVGGDDNDDDKDIPTTIHRPVKRVSKKNPPRSRSSSCPSQSDSDHRVQPPKIPAFVDPRADLARRKARKLSDPPTDAFSSSGGSEDEEGDTKKKKKYRRGEDEFLDELAKIDRTMKKRKRDYREKRMPGYSNPRKN